MNRGLLLLLASFLLFIFAAGDAALFSSSSSSFSAAMFKQTHSIIKSKLNNGEHSAQMAIFDCKKFASECFLQVGLPHIKHGLSCLYLKDFKVEDVYGLLRTHCTHLCSLILDVPNSMCRLATRICSNAMSASLSCIDVDE